MAIFPENVPGVSREFPVQSQFGSRGNHSSPTCRKAFRWQEEDREAGPSRSHEWPAQGTRSLPTVAASQPLPSLTVAASQPLPPLNGGCFAAPPLRVGRSLTRTRRSFPGAEEGPMPPRQGRAARSAARPSGGPGKYCKDWVSEQNLAKKP